MNAVTLNFFRTSRLVTYWLYWDGEPITSVRGPEGLSRREVIDKALAQHDRVPLVDPNLAPFEYRHRLLHAQVTS